MKSLKILFNKMLIIYRWGRKGKPKLYFSKYYLDDERMTLKEWKEQARQHHFRGLIIWDDKDMYVEVIIYNN